MLTSAEAFYIKTHDSLPTPTKPMRRGVGKGDTKHHTADADNAEEASAHELPTLHVTSPASSPRQTSASQTDRSCILHPLQRLPRMPSSSFAELPVNVGAIFARRHQVTGS